MGVLSIVDNTTEEIKRMDDEKKEGSGTSDLTRLFGLNNDGTGGDGDGTENRTEE